MLIRMESVDSSNTRCTNFEKVKAVQTEDKPLLTNLKRQANILHLVGTVKSQLLYLPHSIFYGGLQYSRNLKKKG